MPRSFVIGEEGKGFVYQMVQFQEERMFGAAAGRFCCVSMCYAHRK